MLMLSSVMLEKKKLCVHQNNFQSQMKELISWFLLRLQELTVCSEDNVDVHDIELMQYINVDCSKLKRLLQG